MTTLPIASTLTGPSSGITPKTTLIDRMRHHPVASYFAIAFGLSWAVELPMALAGVRIHEGQAWPTQVPGLVGPIAAAFIMSGVVAGTAGVRDVLRRMGRWQVAGTWYLVALSPLAFYAIGVVIPGALGRGWPNLADLGKFSGLPMVAFPLMWLLLIAAAYPEETGWRGFAADEMLKTRSLLLTAVVIGVLWALWHLPLFFVIEGYRQMGLTFFPVFALGTVCGSIVLTWLYRGSGGSVFIVALWHGSYNLVSGTAAATGVPAAVVTTAVIVWAIIIVIAEVRTGRREHGVKRNLTVTAT